MTFDEYVNSVEQGRYPDDPRVPKSDAYRDKNGIVANLAFGKFGGVAHIRSNAGSIRSNHYHLTDWHFLHVLVGTFRYYWRQVEEKTGGEKKEPQMMRFERGDTFFTPPLVEHAVVAIGYGELVSVSRAARRHEDHERDLVRVKLVSYEDGKLVTHR